MNFWPGTQNTTVQLTLHTCLGQYSGSYNMLFADVILITIPMLVAWSPVP